ncbi:MAG: protease modulator HflC [Myxococcales bacterium]|nr:protease modulator HflC [Myxococcales bacterium]
MRRLLLLLLLLGGVGVALVAAAQWEVGPLVITREGEQKIIFRFNEARVATRPGWTLRLGLPVIERVERYDARWLYLNTETQSIQTKDGEQLQIDNYVIWRIEDPKQFRTRFPSGPRDAGERIDRIVRDDVREVVGRHTLGEVLEGRRKEIMAEITERTRGMLSEFGIDVADVRINRTELPAGTEDSVYARMKTERERLAKKNRAEGEERARRIRAEADREARVIVANADRDAEIARGEGDAQSAQIYAEAYGSAPEFYSLSRTLEAYRKAISQNTTLVLSPDTEFFRYLRGVEGDAKAKSRK